MVSWSHQPNVLDPEAGEVEHRRAKQAWRTTVRNLVSTLRRVGVDADVDLFDWSTRGVD